MLNRKRRGCYIQINNTRNYKLKTVKLFIWVKPTQKVETTKQVIKIHKINSQKRRPTLKIVRKVTTSESGFWLKIESKRFERFLNRLLSISNDQNIKIGLFSNWKVFKFSLTNKNDTKVSLMKIFAMFILFKKNVCKKLF